MDTNQHEREKRQWDLGLERLTKRAQTAYEKSYGTSSPFILPNSYSLIENYAKTIQKVVETRKEQIASEPKRLRAKKPELALFKLIDLFTELDTEAFKTSIPQPDYAYYVIAATVWKRLVDLGTSVQESRIDVKTEIGRLIESQYNLLYFESEQHRLQNILGETTDEEFIESLKSQIGQISNATRLVRDNDAGFAKRRQICEGVLHPKRLGTPVKTSGRQSGLTLTLPNVDHPYEFPDTFKELFALELLNILCIPKNGYEDENDPRPFKIIPSTNSKNGDKIELRQCFIQVVEDMQKRLEGFVYDKLPLIEPPLDWQYFETRTGKNNQSGGYHSQGLRKLEPLVKSQWQCGTVPSKLTIDFVNKLQRTKWTLDEQQLEICNYVARTWHTDYDGIRRPKPYTARDLQENTGNAKSIPAVQFKFENKPERNRIVKKMENGETLTAAEEELNKNWQLAMHTLQGLYREVNKSEQTVKAYREIRERFREYTGDFYFAWNCDYRTRAYPISGQGSPQGAAFERYTLQLAKAEHLSPSGETAALRAIGAAMLDTKNSINDRINWAKSNLDLIREVGSCEAGEYGNGFNRALSIAEGADEPLQFIQLCRHWVAHENGEPWSALVYADATCSGYQIVSALLNSHKGLENTNCFPSSPDKLPQDAYSRTKACVVNWLSDDSFETDLDVVERSMFIELLNSKLGRKLSKDVAKTAVYGSGQRTQCDDIAATLASDGFEFTSDFNNNNRLISKLTALINRAYREELGDVIGYNKQFRRMAELFFWNPGGEERKLELLDLKAQYNTYKKKIDSHRDGLVGLSKKDLQAYVDLCKQIHAKTLLCFEAPDGTLVDLRRNLKVNLTYDAGMMGRPTLCITHKDGIDVGQTFRGCAPGLIHSLDALILKHAYANAPYEIMSVHDSAASHPNNFDDLCKRYRDGFQKATETDVIGNIAKQWNVPNLVMPQSNDCSWRNNIQNATYLFN